MVHDIIWKADSHSDSQKISFFLYGTRRLITVFTKVRHWTLSWASRIQFAPSITISLRSSLLLSSHLRLVFPVDSSLQTSQPKPCKHLSPPHACHMSHPPQPPWFNHPNNIRWRIQAAKFIIMQFSPWSIFIPFMSKYPPQHPVLKNPQTMFLPLSERPSFAPIRYNWQNYSFVYFNL
jgi:hypothetical protein